jgi:peptidoglycan/xylan/chitin deacetylase (PgdA/CDA1 family)
MLERINYFFSPRVLLSIGESTRQKIVRGFREIPVEVERFLAGRYPGFVTARSPAFSCSEVPVFMFHKVSPPSFEEQLRFLKQNGYQTLSLPEFFSFLNGRLRLKGPSVVITFDDGDKSLYTAAFPLLQKYDFQAVAFVVPGCIRETPAAAQSGDWVCWPELMEMERSGVVDIQSHSYYHDQIFIGPKLLDFYQGRFDANPLGLDTPWLEDGDTYTNRLPDGTPIYLHAPSLAGYPRFLDEEPVRRACITFVEEHGGRAFFGNNAWRRKLGSFYYQQMAVRPPRFESPEQQRKRILVDLSLARRTLEERLNKPVRHLCYPWGRGSELAVFLSRQTGYESNFWVIPSGRRPKKAAPFYIPRIKDDYLFRLPGRGRKSLAQIFQGKLQRRRQTLDLY